MAQKRSGLQAPSTKPKPKLLYSQSMPLVPPANTAKTMVRKKTSEQGLSSESTLRDIKFPNEESVMNSNPNVISTYHSRVPEPYQVPIPTKTHTLPGQTTRTVKKIAILPEPGGTLKNWPSNSFATSVKPTPPPKTVVLAQLERKTVDNKAAQRIKPGRDRRRDLAYLVVDLDKRERKQSFGESKY